MGKPANKCACCFVQGGGLFIQSASVALDSCNIFGNAADNVMTTSEPATCPKSQRPYGRLWFAYRMSVLFVRSL